MYVVVFFFLLIVLTFLLLFLVKFVNYKKRPKSGLKMAKIPNFITVWFSVCWKFVSFWPKPFQLKTFSFSTENFSDFNCIALKNQLKICVDNAENGTQNHNKAFGMLLSVNLSDTYAVLVNKSKVKSFKKWRPKKS